jgi:serine/threonine-protein kinase RsbW
MSTNREPDIFEIEVESRIDSLPVISDFLETALNHFQADAGTLYKVQLAVDEASTNVINYAYPEGVGPIWISVKLSSKDLLITIRDKGKSFDPASIPQPDLSADLEDRKIGGLGIYFMYKLMDDVRYLYDPAEGNKLVLKKTITRAAQA